MAKTNAVKHIVSVLINKPSTVENYNAWFVLNNEDYFVQTDIATHDIVKGKTVVKLYEHPEIVKMISRGSYKHKFQCDNQRITDEEALRLVLENVGVGKKTR